MLRAKLTTNDYRIRVNFNEALVERTKLNEKKIFYINPVFHFISQVISHFVKKVKPR